MTARILTRLVGALGVVALASGCSMSAEWWIRKALRDAGFTRSEAMCVVQGVSSSLDEEQTWSVRSALSGLELERRDLAALLEAIRPQLKPEVHGVLVHYVTHCANANSSARR